MRWPPSAPPRPGAAPSPGIRRPASGTRRSCSGAGDLRGEPRRRAVTTGLHVSIRMPHVTSARAGRQPRSRCATICAGLGPAGRACTHQTNSSRSTAAGALRARARERRAVPSDSKRFIGQATIVRHRPRRRPVDGPALRATRGRGAARRRTRSRPPDGRTVELPARAQGDHARRGQSSGSERRGAGARAAYSRLPQFDGRRRAARPRSPSHDSSTSHSCERAAPSRKPGQTSGPSLVVAAPRSRQTSGRSHRRTAESLLNASAIGFHRSDDPGVPWQNTR